MKTFPPTDIWIYIPFRYIYVYICITHHQMTFGSTFHHSLVHRFHSAFWRWFVDGIDWINLLKDGWGALFGWLDRIGPPEEPIAGGKGRRLPCWDAGGCWWMWRLGRSLFSGTHWAQISNLSMIFLFLTTCFISHFLPFCQCFFHWRSALCGYS